MCPAKRRTQLTLHFPVCKHSSAPVGGTNRFYVWAALAPCVCDITAALTSARAQKLEESLRCQILGKVALKLKKKKTVRRLSTVPFHLDRFLGCLRIYKQKISHLAVRDWYTNTNMSKKKTREGGYVRMSR